MGKKLNNVIVGTFLVAGTLLGSNLNADANDPCVIACNAAPDKGAFEYNIFDEPASKGQDICEFANMRLDQLKKGNEGRSVFSKMKGKGCHQICLDLLNKFMAEQMDCSAAQEG